MRVVVVLITVFALACSTLNRSGPDVTCADLGDGAENACADGIVATCRDGVVGWTVCDDKSACDAAWQVPGRYRCAEGDHVPNAQPSQSLGGSGGTGGSSAAGNAGATSGVGGSAANGSGGLPGQVGAGCDSCISAQCSTQLSNCLGDAVCTSLYECIEGCADATCSSSCVTQHPSFDFGQPLRQCVSESCGRECPLWR